MQLLAPGSSGSQAWCPCLPHGRVGLFCWGQSWCVLEGRPLFHWEEGWWIDTEFEAISLSSHYCIGQRKILDASCFLSSETWCPGFVSVVSEFLFIAGTVLKFAWITKLLKYRVPLQIPSNINFYYCKRQRSNSPKGNRMRFPCQRMKHHIVQPRPKTMVLLMQILNFSV